MNFEFFPLKNALPKQFWEEKVEPSLILLETQLSKCRKGAVALSFNGGKDCTVVLELLERSGLLKKYDVKLVCFAENDPFEEVLQFARARVALYEPY